jgi:murein DD-endopeptidase MepM/ murein hydrolase activator NlpD
MKANEYLGRHGGRTAGLFVATVVACATALGAAKADNRSDSQSELAKAILGAQTAGSATDASQARAAVAAPAPVVVAPPPIAFMTPVLGHPINSNFGLRRLPEERVARMHEGVDIAAPTGSPIRATAEGKVASTGYSPSYGKYVEVDHGDGLTSFYAHMSRTAALRVGETVKAGDLLGYVGSTGHSTGAHLHFEIRKDGLHFDPTLFVGRTFASVSEMPLFRSAERGYGSAKARVWRASTKARVRASTRHGGGGGGGRIVTTLRAR